MQFELNKNAVLKRLNYCKELVLVETQIDNGSNITRVKRQAIRRANVLRSIIQGKEIKLEDELYSSVFAFENFLRSELKKIAEIKERITKLSSYYALKNMILAHQKAIKLSKLSKSKFVEMSLDEVEYQIAELLENKNQILADIESQSPISYANYYESIVENFNQIKELTDAEKQRREAVNLELSADRLKDLNQYNKVVGLLKKARATKQKILIEQYEQEEKELLLKVRDIVEGRLNNPEYTKKLDELNAKKHEIGLEIIQNLKNASSVTDEDAEKWLKEKVTITQAVFKKMKRKNMDEADYLNDIKQFYILTNGRLGRVKIDTKNHNRAYAQNIGTYESENLVMLDNDFSQDVLFHELAHHLESDLFMRNMASSYVRSRSLDGERLYKLKDLVPRVKYKASEIAYKTSFPNAYTGKVYRDGTTELLSMATQYFYDPKKLVDIVSQDPSLIEFFSALMIQPKNQLNTIDKNLRDEFINIGDEITADQEADNEESFKFIAKSVTWIDAVSFDINRFSPKDREILEKQEITGNISKVILPNGREFLLFEANKVRYRNYYFGTGVKGYIALDLREFLADEGEYQKESYFGYFTDVNFKTAFPIQTVDKDKVKVLLFSMSYYGELYAHYKDSKGILGEGFLSDYMLVRLIKYI